MRRELREFLLLTLTVVAVGFLLILLWQWVVWG